MRLEIGNKVAVLDAVLKGVVIAIHGDSITIEAEDGMLFKFSKRELVKIEEDQHELSKFSDINNPLLKEKITDTRPPKNLFTKTKNEVILEVDLHINQLVKSTRGLDNYDMLNLQLSTAKRKIEYAISKRISKLVFIHGVGEGVLKAELISLLNRYPLKYYDASYKKYGLGATEVYVYQNTN
ncbi:MAG: Smr/MutS family protein [Polaribacter sp.]